MNLEHKTLTQNILCFLEKNVALTKSPLFTALRFFALTHILFLYERM